MDRWISVVGILVMLACGWLLSSHKTQISARAVLGGVLLQFGLGVLILWTPPGQIAFQWLTDAVNNLINSTSAGCEMVFGVGFGEHYVAFFVLPVIIVCSSLNAVLFHLGVMQVLTKMMAVVMRYTIGGTGPESLVAAANVFLGQTSAPLAAKPFLNRMTDSEVMSIMVSGFGTTAGGTLAGYILFGGKPEYVLAASVMSAPASLLIAKLIQPEVQEPVDVNSIDVVEEEKPVDVIHAATLGALEGLEMALAVGALLVVFVSLVAMVNMGVAFAGDHVQPLLTSTFGWTTGERWSMEMFCGWLFWPFAYVMGTPYEDCDRVGRLLGLRLVTNEFLSYQQFGFIQQGENPLSLRGAMIVTFAMCSFANIGSIGIQIGGLRSFMPDKERVLARFGWRAMLGGTLATFITACVANLLITDAHLVAAEQRAAVAAAEAKKAKAESPADLIDKPSGEATGAATSEATGATTSTGAPRPAATAETTSAVAPAPAPSAATPDPASPAPATPSPDPATTPAAGDPSAAP